jgi:hypothetical protein
MGELSDTILRRIAFGDFCYRGKHGLWPTSSSGVGRKRRSLNRVRKGSQSFHENPEQRKATQRLWRQKNLVKVRADFVRWKEENPDKLRDGQLRAKYGISLAQYEAMLAGQEGRCAICMHTSPGGRGGLPCRPLSPDRQGQGVTLRYM